MTGLIPPLRRPLLAACLAALLTALASGAAAQAPAATKTDTKLDTTVIEAREFARKRDRNRLAAARAALQAGSHPLTPWVEYWDLSSRLPEVQVDEVEAFYARWPGSYVEDRLRNDWLLELGRRRDWPALARDYPRFRMNDDREVSCWWLFTEHLAGKDVADAARPLWFAQRDTKRTGCINNYCLICCIPSKVSTTSGGDFLYDT
jgi:soluble lytic murein transglycosylase